MASPTQQQSGLNCPGCSALVPWKNISFSTPFKCPSCGVTQCVSRSYLYFQAVVTIVVTGIGAYALGMRNTILLSAVVLGFFPVAMIVSFLTRRLVPPTLKLGDD